ncbi:MAG: hypothetical protein DRQ58_09130 [Gammaproteobacteria bacterium]|nr:MAG: hypothetical protein DRQ58_09130 [Gammaproteobacteria bacterium]
MVKLNQLENALALETHGNFYRAAIAQNISQPALSRSIQKLENSMGTILFNRNQDRVVPTDFGKILLARAKTIVGEAGELQREMTQLQDLEAGHLSVSFGVYPAELSGCRAIGELIRLHPNLHCQIKVHEWRFIIRQVIDRSIDLGVAEISTLRDDDATLAIEPLGRHDAVFFCRKGHPLLGRSKVSKADLDKYPLAAVNLPPRVVKLFPGMTRVSKTTGDLAPSVEIDNLAMARSIVEKSDAFGTATLLQIEPWLKSGSIGVLPYRRKWLKLSYGFIYLRHHQLSPVAIKFMELMRSIETRLMRRNMELMKQMFPD